MNPYNGYANFRNRKLLIVWTGQYAEHLAEGHYLRNSIHPYLHVKVQKILQKHLVTKLDKDTICAIFEKNRIVVIPVLIQSNFAIPKTCYIKGNNTMANNLGNIKAVKSGTKTKIFVDLDEEFLSAVAKEYDNVSTQQMSKMINHSLNKNYRFKGNRIVKIKQNP
jgi:hypothetical protein